MKDLQNRAALERHWTASAAGDQDAEHEIYHDDAIYFDVFWVAAVVSLGLVFLVFLMKRSAAEKTTSLFSGGSQNRPAAANGGSANRR